MLKLFSRMERTRSYVIIAFAVLMGLSLIFFYAPSQNSAVSSSGLTREVLARVRGDSITVGELEEVKAGYQRMFSGRFNPAQFGEEFRRHLIAAVPLQRRHERIPDFRGGIRALVGALSHGRR